MEPTDPEVEEHASPPPDVIVGEEVVHAPPPPAVVADPLTGELSGGWKWAGD